MHNVSRNVIPNPLVLSDPSLMPHFYSLVIVALLVRLRSAFVVRPMKRQRGSQNGDDGPFQASQPLRPDALHYASDLMVGFKYMKPAALEDAVATELDDDSTNQLRMVHDSCSEKVELI